MSLHTMPLNVGDFLRDTQELNDAEGGSYIFILIALWGSKEGRLPNNQTVLRRIARCGPKKWASTWPALIPYLEISEEWVTHKRVSSERQRVAEKVAKNRAAGKKGGDANALNYIDTEEANASANASAKSKRTPKQSKPNSPIGEKTSEAKASGADAPTNPEVSDRDFVWSVGKALLIEAGSEKKSAGATIGELVRVKGLLEAKRIIIAAQAKPKLEAKSYLWRIIHGKAEPTEDIGAAPQVELVLVNGKPTLQPVSKVAA